MRKFIHSVGVGMYRGAKRLSTEGVPIATHQYEALSWEIGEIIKREFSDLLGSNQSMRYLTQDCLDRSRSAYWHLYNQGIEQAVTIPGANPEDSDMPHGFRRMEPVQVSSAAASITWNDVIWTSGSPLLSFNNSDGLAYQDIAITGNNDNE